MVHRTVSEIMLVRRWFLHAPERLKWVEFVLYMMSMDHFFHLLPEARKIEYLKVIQSIQTMEDDDDSINSRNAKYNDDIADAMKSLTDSLFERCDLTLGRNPSATLIISLFESNHFRTPERSLPVYTYNLPSYRFGYVAWEKYMLKYVCMLDSQREKSEFQADLQERKATEEEIEQRQKRWLASGGSSLRENCLQLQDARYLRAMETMGKPMVFSWNAILEADQDTVKDMPVTVAKDVALKCAIADPSSFLKELENHRDPRLMEILPQFLASYKIEGMESEVHKVMQITSEQWGAEESECDSGRTTESDDDEDDKSVGIQLGGKALQTATELGNKLTNVVVQQRLIDRMCDKLKVIRLKRHKSYRRSESETTELESLSKVLDQLKWIDKHVTGQGRREAGKH